MSPFDTPNLKWAGSISSSSAASIDGRTQKRFAFRNFNAAVLKSDNFAALITHLYKPTFLGVYLNTLDRSCLSVQTVPLLAADVPGGEKMRSRGRKLQQQPCLISFASSPPCNSSVTCSKKILSFYAVHLF